MRGFVYAYILFLIKTNLQHSPDEHKHENYMYTLPMISNANKKKMLVAFANSSLIHCIQKNHVKSSVHDLKWDHNGEQQDDKWFELILLLLLLFIGFVPFVHLCIVHWRSMIVMMMMIQLSYNYHDRMLTHT